MLHGVTQLAFDSCVGSVSVRVNAFTMLICNCVFYM